MTFLFSRCEMKPSPLDSSQKFFLVLIRFVFWHESENDTIVTADLVDLNHGLEDLEYRE